MYANILFVHFMPFVNKGVVPRIFKIFEKFSPLNLEFNFYSPELQDAIRVVPLGKSNAPAMVIMKFIWIRSGDQLLEM